MTLDIILMQVCLLNCNKKYANEWISWTLIRLQGDGLGLNVCHELLRQKLNKTNFIKLKSGMSFALKWGSLINLIHSYCFVHIFLDWFTFIGIIICSHKICSHKAKT